MHRACLLLELRYARASNVRGTTLDPALDPRLRYPEALGLKLWDAYRSLALQQRMWDAIRDPRYVSDPVVNAGQRGRSLPMPNDFHDSSEAAHQGAPGIPAEPIANARRLRAAMGCRCFQAFATDWGHFDRHDWQALPVVR